MLSKHKSLIKIFKGQKQQQKTEKHLAQNVPD